MVEQIVRTLPSYCGKIQKLEGANYPVRQKRTRGRDSEINLRKCYSGSTRPWREGVRARYVGRGRDRGEGRGEGGW